MGGPALDYSSADGAWKTKVVVKRCDVTGFEECSTGLQNATNVLQGLGLLIPGEKLFLRKLRQTLPTSADHVNAPFIPSDIGVVFVVLLGNRI